MKRRKDIESTVLVKRILKLIYYLLIIITVCMSLHIGKNYGIFNIIFRIYKILVPFIIGYVISFILKPVLDKLKILGIPKIFGSIIVYIGIFIIIFLMLKYILPGFKEEFIRLYPYISKYYIKLCEISPKIETFINSYLNQVPSKVVSISTNLITIIIEFLVGLVIGLYILINDFQYGSLLRKVIPHKYFNFYDNLVNKLEKEVRHCISGTFIVSFFVFITSLIAFLIIGIPDGFIYAIICGITDLIPYFGPYIGGIPVIIVAFSMSRRLGIVTIVICIIIQGLENYLFSPIIMSKQTKMNPLLILFGLLLFGRLFGIIGLLIATPLLSIIRVLVIEVINNYKLIND